MHKPRLTIITNNLYVFAGGEKLALDIATGLKNDFDITILNPVSTKDTTAIDRKKLMELYDLQGIELVDLANIGMKAKIFGEESVVFKAMKPGAFAKFANAIRKSDVIYLMSLNPLIILNSVFFARLYRKKLVLGIHNFSIAKIVESRDTVKSRIVRSNVIHLLRRIKYFHVTSRRDLALIHKIVPKADVRLIPNPIRDEKKPIVINSREFVCLYVGRLEKSQKGIDLLCKIIERTLSQDDRIKFKIVGAGGDGERMVAELAKKQPKNVKWLGFLSGKKLEEAYASASLLAFPSRYDTFSIVLVESQGKGIPAVAFDIDGSRDMLRNSFQGIMVPAFDTAKFSDEIERYRGLWKDKKKYKRLMEKIQASAYANYGKDKVLGELKSFFAESL